MRNTKFTEIKKMWEEKDFDNFIVAYMPVVQRYAKKIYEDNKLCLSNVEYASTWTWVDHCGFGSTYTN